MMTKCDEIRVSIIGNGCKLLVDGEIIEMAKWCQPGGGTVSLISADERYSAAYVLLEAQAGISFGAGISYAIDILRNMPLPKLLKYLQAPDAEIFRNAVKRRNKIKNERMRMESEECDD